MKTIIYSTLDPYINVLADVFIFFFRGFFLYASYKFPEESVQKNTDKPLRIYFKAIGMIAIFSYFMAISLGTHTEQDDDYDGLYSYGTTVTDYIPSKEQRIIEFIRWSLQLGIPVIMGIKSGIEKRNHH